MNKYDLFISAYEECERVLETFALANAKEKLWLLFPQYSYGSVHIKEANISINAESEDEYFQKLFDLVKIDAGTSICIDITGFIRPHLIYLVRYLSFLGLKKIDIIYTEPRMYAKGERTDFSGFIERVEIIPGCSASIVNPQTDNDLLIIGAGYDDKLISKIAQDKRHCKKKYQIFGFPSLQADMYQESIVKAYNVKESVGENVINEFSPAYDPFITASTIQTIVDSNSDATNIYLSPLSSKPQVLGFAFYYSREGVAKPVSIIYPYSKKYLLNTTVGAARTWHYQLQF